MNFLPVGHTHEDIDAFFGVYSKHLDKLRIFILLKVIYELIRQDNQFVVYNR